MLSVPEIRQTLPDFNCLDFCLEFRINNQLHSFNIHSMDQVFMGKNISFKRAIEQKVMLQCLLDIGKDLDGDFLTIGSLSLTWKPKKRELYIGNLWIEPDFRGNGVGTSVLTEITNFADVLEIVLTLHAIPFISPEIKPTIEDILVLKNFYRRFGFKEKAETQVLGLNSAMKRLPRIKKPHVARIIHSNNEILSSQMNVRAWVDVKTL